MTTDNVVSTAPSTEQPPAVVGGVLAPQPLDTLFPQKTRVMGQDGAFDLEATARKTESHRAALERRLGMGDIRPELPADYQLEVAEENGKYAAALGEKGLADFKAKAHALGLTDSQFSGVMNEFLATMPALAGDLRTFDNDRAIEALREAWPSEADYKQNIGRSLAAVQAFGGDDAPTMIARYGSDPGFVKAWAAVGAEMGEDRAPTPLGQSQESVKSLMSSEAYSNAKHPDHARVSAQVRGFFESRPGGNHIISHG